jgi:hypothetical protein
MAMITNGRKRLINTAVIQIAPVHRPSNLTCQSLRGERVHRRRLTGVAFLPTTCRTATAFRPSTRVDWLVRIWSVLEESFFTIPGSDELIEVFDFRLGIAVGVCLGNQHREAV